MYTAYKKVEIEETGEIVGTGWLPPLPDLRDYTEEQAEIAGMAKKLGISPTGKMKALPAQVDLRSDCSPIENQGNLGSCSAHAGMGIVEYSERELLRTILMGPGFFSIKPRGI
jgi:C1A family cysteine protease